MRRLLVSRSAIFIFMLALAVRLPYLSLTIADVGAEAHLSLTPDTSSYVGAARALTNGTNAYQEPFLSFGPGYPLFLLFCFKLFGETALVILLLQVLLSAISCLLLFVLTERLTGSRFIAFIAGVLLATSLTSVELCSVLLSDTLFFFLLALSLLLGVESLYRESRLIAGAAGIVTGAAILTRSIGQFLPIMAIIIVLVLYFWRASIPALHGLRWRMAMKCLLLWVCIAVAFEGGWILRNWMVSDVPALSSAGAGASANIAAMSLHPDDITKYRETMLAWEKAEQDSLHVARLSSAQGYRMRHRRASTIFWEDPVGCVRVALRVIWINLKEVSMMHRSQFKELRNQAIGYEYVIRDNYLYYVELILSLVGLAVLLARRQFHLAIILGALSLNFTLPLAATMYQGSRIAFPMQIATIPLMAYAIGTLILSLRMIAKTALHRGARPD